MNFYPGWYDNGTAMRALMGGGCNKVFWFHPGDYLFDFTDADAATHEWLVGNKDVFVTGGTPKGWDPAAVTQPTMPFPGSCKTSADAAPNDGVQFVFANDSRLHISGGTMELCAKPSTTQQQIAIYGVKTTAGTPPTGTPSPAPTFTPTPSPTPSPTGTPSPTCASVGTNYYLPGTAAAESGSSTWTNLSGSKNLVSAGDFNESPEVDATTTVPKAGAGGIDFGSFGTIPAGCSVTSVTLFLRHSESPNANVQNVKLNVKNAAGLNINKTASKSSCASGDFCSDTSLDPVDKIDLTLSGINSAASFAGLTVNYDVGAQGGTNGGPVTETLDGLGLKIVLASSGTPSPSPSPTASPPPGGSSTNYFRAESGCITQAPYPTSGCALVKTDGAQTKLSIQGTVYAPLAALDIAMTNVSTQILGRGAVIRLVRLSVTPSTTYSGPMIEVPADSPSTAYTNRHVTLTATVAGDVRLRALVRFVDQDPTGAMSPGYGVVVEAWSVLP
ncbi:MAG: hypothetical protein LC750_13390 [Actinobacteria bacterium]|nr:hypothetical protein [Actinomycetota bacterium]